MGMITMGYVGDRIGRKWGSVTTVSIMLVRRLLVCAQGIPHGCGTAFWLIMPYRPMDVVASLSSKAFLHLEQCLRPCLSFLCNAHCVLGVPSLHQPCALPSLARPDQIIYLFT